MHTRRATPRCSLPGAAALLLLLSAACAVADEARAPLLALQVEGACPAETDVRAALREALPEIRFAGAERGTEPPAGTVDESVAIQARVSDRGARLAVEVGASERVLSRPSRDCLGRAREAALAIALLLDPPLLAEPTVEPTAEVPAPAVAVAPATQEPPFRVALSASALGAGTLHEGLAASAGATLRVDMARGAWGASLGIGALAPVHLAYGAGSARLTRVSLDLSATLGIERPRYVLGVQLGLALVPFVASGEAVAIPRTGSGLDAGVRVGLVAVWRALARFGVTVGLEAVVVPAPALLVVDRGPSLGPTPWLFAGLSLGLRWQIR